MHNGFVSLIGAGPGDPELITVKGLRRLGAADVVIYDALVNEALLRTCRADAELIYAGKRAYSREAAGGAVLRNAMPRIFARAPAATIGMSAINVANRTSVPAVARKSSR